MTTENIPTVAEIQEATLNMLTVTEGIESSSDDMVDQYGDTRKTWKGIENEAAQQISDQSDTFQDSMTYQSDTFQDRFARITPSLEWPSETEITNELQIYHTGIIGEVSYSTWLANPNLLPFTTSATFAEDEVLGRWTSANVATQEWSILNSIARSLGVSDGGVIYTSDIVTNLNNVSHLYNSSTQRTYKLPTISTSGETIVSVVDDVLTTSTTETYQLMLLVESETVDARSFGVVGDGVTDDSTALYNWLTYILSNNKNGKANNLTIMLSDVVNIIESWGDVNISIDFTGSKLIPDSTYDITSNDFALLSIRDLIYSKDSFIQIINLNVDCVNLVSQWPTAAAATYGLGAGGVRIYGFGNVVIDNPIFKDFYQVRGLWISEFNRVVVNNYRAVDVGVKAYPEIDYTGEFDSIGDALYLSEYQGNDATATINGMVANSPDGYIGRAGVVIESTSDDDGYLELSLNDYSPTNYNRSVHSENATKCNVNWKRGKASECSLIIFCAGYYSELHTDELQELKCFNVENVDIFLNQSLQYGGKNGLTSGVDAGDQYKSASFSKCNIHMTINQSASHLAEYENCNFIVSDGCVMTFVHSGPVFDNCNLSFTDSSQFYFFEPLGENIPTFVNRCRIESDLLTTVRPILTTIGTTLFDNCTLINAFPRHTNGTETIKYRGCDFELNDETTTETALFNDSDLQPREFYNTTITNNTSLVVSVGDSSSGLSSFDGGKLTNVYIYLVGGSADYLKTRIIKNLEMIFSSSTVFTYAIRLSSTSAILTNLVIKLNVANAGVSIPADGTAVKVANSYVVTEQATGSPVITDM